MKHYLNVCDVNGAEVEPVDVITFGSPCQDLSVAGKRKGLKHEDKGDEETTRSGLFMEAVRIIKEMREKDGLSDKRTNEHIRPRFAVWENVPGAFSSNKGQDFRVVLEELARIKDAEVSIPMPEKGKWKPAGEIVGDGWSIAWRTLDAQYHGVPQRRRRIFLVADFADECAGEILFECKGLPGYPPESSETWEGVTGDSENSIGESGERYCVAYNGENITSPLNKTNPKFGDPCHTLGTDSRNYVVISDINPPYTLQIRSGCEGGGKGPLIQTDKSSCLTAAQTQTLFQPIGFNRERCGAVCMENKMPTILAASGESGNNMPMVCCIQGSMIGRKDENGPQVDGVNVDKSFTLNTIDRHAVAYGICSYASNSMKSDNPHSGIYEANTARTLDLNGGNPACNQGGICICEPVVMDITHANDVLRIYEDGVVPCLQHRMGTGGNQIPLVAEPFTYQNTTGPLMANSHPGSYSGQDAYNDMFVTEKKCYSIDDTKMANTYIWEEQANTLAARDFKGPQAVCYGVDCRNNTLNEELFPTIQAKENGGQSLNYSGALCEKYTTEYIVRRLTPTECARLQGMPDEWCRLSYIDDMSDEDYEFWKLAQKTHAEINGKKYREKSKDQMIKWYNKLRIDGAEYKAYGNGMSLPCVRVPIHGIAKKGSKTMASLFDGIGGFPLAGLIDGIQTLWTSEIELFPIAVTKERFGEYEKYGYFTFCD